MRDDIISIIRGQKNLTHVFIATFNIDFVFIESVLLRELKRCGQPTLTILADADEVTSSFESQGRWVSRVGRRYRVVPIRMEPGFRFHPKAVLLSGPEHCELLIGSGNLTFGGMRQNEEVWLRFDSRNDETAPISAFRRYADQCLARGRRTTAAKTELEEAFDTATHKWTSKLDDPAGLLSRAGVGDSMLDQMEREVGDLAVHRIVIASPYFDDAGQALSEIARRWPTAEIEVLVQESQSHLQAATWEGIRDPKMLTLVTSAREDGASPFIHAKLYAFAGPSEAVVFAGSANCSRAALVIPGSQGNAELLAITRVEPGDLDETVFSSMTAHSESPALRDSPPEIEPHTAGESVRIVAASLSNGRLTIEFDGPNGANISGVLVDGQKVDIEDTEHTHDTIMLRWIGTAHRVALQANDGDGLLTSRDRWIDNEFLLSATSRQRQVAQALGDHVAPGQWTFQGWTEIMRLLGDNLRYTPTRRDDSETVTPQKAQASESIAAHEFFTDDYRLPGHRHEHGLLDDSARVIGLRGLLLEYFGIDHDAPQEDGQTEGDTDTDNEMVDRPENAKQKRKLSEADQSGRHKKRSLSDAEQRRGRRIARQIVETCTTPEFIENRPPSMLGSDLAIAAVLLVSGHAEGWLADEDFVDLTYQMWSFLFFDDGSDAKTIRPAAGALERRFQASSDQATFVDTLRSTRLAASLATWSFSCPAGLDGNEAARFGLASRLAVARLPWIWCLNDLAGVEAELVAIAQRTSWLGKVDSGLQDSITSAWNSMLEQGNALARLEHVLKNQDLASLRESIDARRVEAGSLLWQGPKLGFCVLSKAADRTKPGASSVPVLSLRATHRELKLQPSYLLPFSDTIKFAATLDGSVLNDNHVTTLAAFERHISGT
jgi:hypothetical protein